MIMPLSMMSEESSGGVSCKTSLTALTISRSSLEIAFNYHFVEELLHAINGDSVSIEFSGESSPGVFSDPTDPDFLHLIMPVKVQS